jgi:hypothetical protein
VDAQAQEAFDLDFKKARYGNSDSERRKLAGDVAAMANTAGGVILINEIGQAFRIQRWSQLSPRR